MMLIAAVTAVSYTGYAQQTTGKVVYERVAQMQIRLSGGPAEESIQNMLPRTRKDEFELQFANGQSIWKQVEKEMEEPMSFGDGAIQIRTASFGSDDVVYYNFEAGKRVDRRELFDKTFIVDDSIRSLKWKMTGETKDILGHKCMKATSSQVSKRTQTLMEDGKIQKKDVVDTSEVVAWFATDIPVQAGPAEYQGQLPGLILEMDVANGRQVYKAISLSAEADVAQIKAPTGKKRYTADEFQKERAKMFEQMEKSGGGGGRVMRVVN